MRSKILPVIVLVLLICSACKKGGELRGSVFIVTKGGENYKLGLVKVSAIPEDRMKQFVENKKGYIRTHYDKLKTYQDSFKNSFDAAQQNYDAAKKAFDVVSAEKNKLTARQQELNSDFDPYGLGQDTSTSEYSTPEQQAEQGRQRKIQQQLQAVKQQIAKYDPLVEDARAKMNDAEKRLSELKSEALANQQKILELLNEEVIYEGLPEGSIKAVTDADGKFTLTLPTSGKYAIAAHSNRRVYDSTEKYYWLIWVSLDGQASKQIMLTNQNLLGQDSREAVFNFKELIPGDSNVNRATL